MVKVVRVVISEHHTSFLEMCLYLVLIFPVLNKSVLILPVLN